MLERFDALHRRVVSVVEDHPTPLPRYALLFLALLAVRMTLEFFSSHRLYTAADLVHIGLWFAFIVLAMTALLQFFSGERAERVAKLTVVFFMFAWSAPLIDLLIGGGIPARMSYLPLNQPGQVLRAYLTAGGPSLARGATLGIRIEIALLVLACFNYLRLKTGGTARALIGAWAIYTVLFLSGAIPWLLGGVVRAFGLSYGSDDRSIPLLLACAVLALLLWLYARHAPGALRELAAATPWGAWLLALLHFAIGAGFARAGYPGAVVLDPSTLFWIPLLLALALALGVYAGAPGGDAGFGTVVLLLSAGVGALLSVRLMFVTLLIWALLYLLREPPLQIARVPLVRNLFAAALFAACALLGFVALGGPMVGFPRIWLLGLLALAALGGLFAEFGRAAGDAVAWLNRWSEKSRRNFHALTLALILLGFVAAAAWLAPGPRERWWLAACAPFPLAVFHFRPRRTQWICAALAPAYAILARAAWETTP